MASGGGGVAVHRVDTCSLLQGRQSLGFCMFQRRGRSAGRFRNPKSHHMHKHWYRGVPCNTGSDDDHELARAARRCQIYKYSSSRKPLIVPSPTCGRGMAEVARGRQARLQACIVAQNLLAPYIRPKPGLLSIDDMKSYIYK